MSDKQANVCEEKVFDDLFRRYSGDLYKFLYYKYGEDNNPHDIVQEAFIKLWDNCQNVPPDKAKSFLFTVASNRVLNEISKKKTALNYTKDHSERSHSIESPQYIMEEQEYMDCLKEALESLTEEQRVTFLLNRIEGKKHKEIAEMLGISQKAVEKRIYTAIKILKDKIKVKNI